MRRQEKEGEEHKENKERTKGRERREEGKEIFTRQKRARIFREKRQTFKRFALKCHNIFLHSTATLQNACPFPSA